MTLIHPGPSGAGISPQGFIIPGEHSSIVHRREKLGI